METVVDKGASGGRESAAFGGAYAGRRVLVTGHTGFKGSWLTFWLRELGADVCGYALEPPTEPNLFSLLGLEDEVAHHVADVRDLPALEAAFDSFRPEIVFHLAAQPLVRASYADPVLTYQTNVLGTVNVLEAARRAAAPAGAPRVIVNVTSDKCYENRESAHAYAEHDPLGGFDPYSSSKGCSELVTAAYRRSFFARAGAVHVASARAGNVIGGGDWAPDRIVPDCVRALAAGEPVLVRHPGAVRPWQHVLESLSGYLWLAARMWQAAAAAGDGAGGSDEGTGGRRERVDAGGRAAARHEAARFDSAWNFGPSPDANQTVQAVVELLLRVWGEGEWHSPEASLGALEPHEAGLLLLDASKAREELGWRPVWGFAEAVQVTAAWYKTFAAGAGRAELRRLTLAEIDAYRAAAASRAAWASPVGGGALS